MGYDFQTDHQRHPSLHPYHGPFMADLVSAFQTAGGEYTRYVSAYAGDANATGAPGDPFNVTSAAAAGVDNAIQQALDSFPVPTTAKAEDAVKIVVMESGIYLGSLTLTHRRIMLYGKGSQSALQTPGNVTRTISAAVAGGVKTPELVITGDSSVDDYDNGGGNFAIAGTLTFGDAGAGLANFVVTTGLNQVGPVVADGGGMTGGIAWTMSECRFAGGLALLSADLVKVVHCVHDGSVECATINAAWLSFFDGTITVSSAPGFGYGPQGFWSCDLGGVATFDGPAGSALFDAASQASYDATGVAFASGAGPADFIEPRTEFVGAVFDCAANATAQANTTNGKAGLVDRATITVQTPPTSAAGTVLLDITMNGTSILAAPFDAETLVAGVKTVLPLSVGAGDLDAVEGGLFEFEIVSDNADMLQGTDMRFTVDVVRDGRIATT